MGELFRRTPLRVKLVAAVLALVTVALVVICVASTVYLRSYLTDRVDRQLVDVLREVEALGIPVDAGPHQSLLRSDYVFAQRLPNGLGIITYDRRFSHDDLPPVPSLEDAVERADDPYTANAVRSGIRWRMLVTPYPNGSAVAVGYNMSDVDSAVSRLIWTELLVGAGVLLLLATVGVWAVRTSLQPLRQIEQTAGAIAAGDLSRRVPDPEPGPDPPRTEVGRLSHALNAMLAQIEAAFAARAASEDRMRRFVADASHELRTPLTSIRGFAELYRQGAVGSPDDVARLMRRIEDEAARMGLLVEDLLLLARLDQERPLVQAPVELPVIVSDAVQAAQAIAPDRQIELEVRSDGVPLVVRGDDARLRQVVGNLLSNAVNHTPAGSAVTVRLSAEPPTAVIEVVDQGPGLTPEQAQRVFERFYRADSARSRRSGGGTGLGLAIVAALVAAHRGTVEVDSVPGKGATFRVRLPLAADGRPAEIQSDHRRVED
jgi:two-component system OmpR family sensor kinase